MRIATAAGRAMLGWLFVHAGLRVVRTPTMAAALSAPTLAALRARAPMVPADDVVIVRANAVLHLLAGSLLVAGRVPRLSAAALAVSLVPTTLAGHAYWTVEDPKARHQQKSQFEKNVAILGGLLAVAGSAIPREEKP